MRCWSGGREGDQLDALARLGMPIAEATDGPEHLFISFDIDCLDPAYAPGTGTPEPGGFTPREMFPMIRRLCAESNVVGFDLVELLPYGDSGYTTVLNSNRLCASAWRGSPCARRASPSRITCIPTPSATARPPFSVTSMMSHRVTTWSGRGSALSTLLLTTSSEISNHTEVKHV